MKTNRQIFSNFLGAESGKEIRRLFSSSDIQARIDSAVAIDLAKADFSGPSTLTKLATSARKRLEPVRAGFHRLATSIATDESNSHALRSKAALESAPFLVGSQHLIHCFCGSWNNESRHATAALRIHAADLGVGQPRASRIHRYQELLRRYRLSDAGEDLLHTGGDLRISDGAFNFASGLVVLSYFPESLAGEILGANLYLRQCALLPYLEFVAHDDPDARQYLNLAEDPSGSSSDLLGLAETAVTEFLRDTPVSNATSIRRGYCWARSQAEEMSQALLGLLDRWIDPREAAQHLVERRRLDASQYHEKLRLNGVPMQLLLAKDSALPFLDALASSPFVREGKPDSSPLLTSLISPRGKMFRIFDADDIAILKRWIAGLPYAAPSPQPAAHQLWQDDGAFSLGNDTIVQLANVVPNMGARQAYPRLLHAELTHGEETFAMQYVARWLTRARSSVEKGKCPLPAEWAPGLLRQWLQQQHKASNKALEEDRELASRESVVDDILSLAPLTMIDGSWLARFVHPAVGCSGYGYRLFETFFDELGNGIESQNHPVIYRNLLKAVYGDLPATVDSDYANASCFDDQNFDLPVFWLAIGRYPLTFCPEILGLNLAMELSGVGGGYRRTHEALVAYGYPTMFVDLHNSIDNISSGHTAWAAASLDAYISAFPRGESAALWARIRTGFAALNPPKEQTMMDKFREKIGLPS